MPLICVFGFVPLASLFADYSFTQESDPAGLFSSVTHTGEAGSTANSLSPILRKEGYRFTHWSVNGLRQAAADGSSRITFGGTLDGNLTAIAHYLLEGQDSDADSFPDWLELRTYGTLNKDGADDADDDGFSLELEQKSGLVPSIKDEIRQGRVARRRSRKVSVNFGGANVLTVRSDPQGIVASTVNLFDLNSSHLSPNPPESQAGYAFGYWTLNGQRVADPTGAALPQAQVDLNESVELVAKYFSENEDTDRDGMPDWQEWNAFGNLDQDESSDGDGFSTSDEVHYGLNAAIADEITQGNVARRRSKKVFLNLGGAKNLTVESDPPGFVARSEINSDVNASYQSPDPARKLAGYAFAYWTRNGTRVADSTGTAILRPSGVLETDVELVAKYLPEKQDSDADGTPDWQEWNAFGNLDHNAGDDEDGDGFLLGRELQYGLHPAIADLVEQGGVSRRRARRVGLSPASLDQNQSSEDRDGDGLTQAQELALGLDPDKADTDGDGFSDSVEVSRGSNANDSSSLANYPPGDILLDNNTTSENLPAGSIVGDFNATDPDANSTHVFSLAEGNGSTDNAKFTLDANGTLKTAVIFDYETNATTLNVRVRATDELNATKEKTFVIQVTNVVEDLDQDGVEDFYDTDADGDGFTDSEELAYGSDPRNANSVANQPPSAIDLNGTTVGENEPTGTIAGRFALSDPDANATIAITFAEGNGSTHNQLFTLDDNGTLRTAVTFDYETNATSLSIRVRATDEHNASLEKTFTIAVANVVEDLDGDAIEDFYDTDDDGDGFTDAEELAYGSNPRNPNSVANQPPGAIDLNGSTIGENEPTGTIAGRFALSDPDANATIAITFAEGNGSTHNQLFTLDANGTLRATVTFDYETNATTLNIRVRATDEHNASLEKTFTIAVANVVEDLDGDAIEDFYDPDDDNDGFSDASELAYGSDPRDPDSLVNSSPDGITLNNLRVAEGRPVGDLVATVRASDPDDANGTGAYEFDFVDGNGSADNGSFTLDQNGTLRTATVLDFESNASRSIRLRVTDEHNASLEKSFVIEVINLPEQNALPVEQPPPALPDWLAAAQPIGEHSPEWFTSSWFGSFFRTSTPWLYHSDLGWIYGLGDGSGNAWIWHEDQGWFWTGQTLYHYLYRSSDGVWLYFLARQNGRPYFYNSATGSVE